MRKGVFVLLAALVLPALALADSVPVGWTCTGNCGTSGANGAVSLSPAGNSAYEWVSTSSGLNGVGVLPSGGLGSETNGSTLASPIFTATAGDPLNFYFDYVTSDGAGFADYAWAALFNSSNSLVAILFTARSEPSPTSVVPGSGMPPPTATLNPSSAPINTGAGSTDWAPLGDSSGTCYIAFGQGCGNSGWVDTSYTIGASGGYYVEIGVINWDDTLYQSGLAMDGLTVAGEPVGGGTSVPEPGSIALLFTGLLGLGGLARRRSLLA